MTYLTEELKKLGVKFVQQKVTSLDKLASQLFQLGVDSGGGVASPVRLVINCCGLHGDDVCRVDGDQLTPAASSSSSSSTTSAGSYPIRGQVIRYTFFFLTTSDTAITNGSKDESHQLLI